jgi:hypothetical protein
LPRRNFEDEPADVRTLRAMVNMPLVSVFAVRTVRLDARQVHGAAGAVRAFPMIEIRRHGDALSLTPVPPPMVYAFRDASFLIRLHDRRRTLGIFVVAQTSKRFRGMGVSRRPAARQLRKVRNFPRFARTCRHTPND